MMLETVEAVVEIEKGSQIKYEWDRAKNMLVVDRILRDNFKYPCVYGFIPNTLDWDGDELDVLIFTSENFLPGVSLRLRIIGALQMVDEGETDTKLIGVHADDFRLEKINSLAEIPKNFLEEVSYFFSNYKNWKKPNATQVSGFKEVKWANQELVVCKELFQKYHLLPKKEFIAKMQKEFPDKYTV